MARTVRTICILILFGLILAALTLDATAAKKPGAPVGIRSKDQARQVAEGLQSKYPEKRVSTSGIAAVNAVEKDGRVWLTAVGDGIGQPDVAEAGFKTANLQITGSSFSGVTVTATVHVGNIQSHGDGSVRLILSIYEDTRRKSMTRESLSTGTHSFTSSPFTMIPGKDYHAQAVINCGATGKNAIRTVTDAQITSIKWNF